MEKKESTVDEYILQFCPEIQNIMRQVRMVIRQAVPESTEKISWGMPTFVYYGNLVHFAGHKNHLGFYPGVSGIERFQEDFKEFHFSKGAAQFPYTKPIPYDLIRKITVFRACENKEQADKK